MIPEIFSHRSIRSYLPEPVPEEVLRRILEAGIRAIFARKGDAIVDTNLAAFRAGYAYAQKQTAQWEGCR